MLATLTAAVLTSPILINPDAAYQKWEGWGTSLCWWASVVGKYPSALREELTKKVIADLGLTVVRYNIGGGDAPGHAHMQPRCRIDGYLRQDGTYDWTADAGQRWVLQRCKEMGADRFESFSNAPPYFMTFSGCASGSTDGSNNLKPENTEAFAKYLVEVNEHFRTRWGITFETLEPLNEPSGTWWREGGRQEGCPETIGDAQSAILAATARELARRSSRTKVAGTDESDLDTALRSWDGLSAEAKKSLWRFNTHHYGGSAQSALHERISKAKKRLWMSESGDRDGSGMTMAGRIVEDLRKLEPSAWIYWQAIDQTGSNWGFLDMDLNGGGRDYVVNKRYYAMANFSRFIRPGAWLLRTDDEGTVASLLGNRLTVVMVNPRKPRTARLNLSHFRQVGRWARVFRTSPEENLKELPTLPVDAKSLDVELPASSITTVTLDGCQTGSEWDFGPIGARPRFHWFPWR